MQLGVYEWCWSGSFDPNDPDHCRLANVFETALSLPPRAPYDRSIPAAISALQAVGMEVLLWDDLGSRHDLVPWYSPLKVALSNDAIMQLFDQNVFGGLSQEAASVLVESAILKVGNCPRRQYAALNHNLVVYANGVAYCKKEECQPEMLAQHTVMGRHLL